MSARSPTPDAPIADHDVFTAWLTASCQRQGVPVTIRDPGVITQVAILLGAASPVRSLSSARGRTTDSSRHRNGMEAGHRRDADGLEEHRMTETDFYAVAPQAA